jgi:cell division septation protein DedD
MSKRPGFLADVSWLQVAVSALAAVTAAWIASRLGVAGTLIGAALGSSVVTISSAFYGRTLDKGKTLIVQTASGTVVQKAVDEGEIAEAFEQAQEVDGSPVTGARVVDDAQPRRLHWKTIIATTVLVLAIAVGVIGAYEAVTGDPYGNHSDNHRIGKIFGSSGSSGGSGDSGSSGHDDPDPKPTSTKTGTVEPAPTPPAATDPAPAPTTPAPTAKPAPAPTPTPTPTAPKPTTPTPTATPTGPAE